MAMFHKEGLAATMSFLLELNGSLGASISISVVRK